MLNLTILLQILVVNKIFDINTVNSIESSNKLIEKFIELKTRKLSKLEKLF